MYRFDDYGRNVFDTKPDVTVAGAGMIGLSIAFELCLRGAKVTVLEPDGAMRHASSAAAGMLAAEDPHNPPELLALSRYSRDLYPEYLRRIERLSGVSVPFQTEVTWQYLEDGSKVRLAERSVDPRQLGEALVAAVRAAGVELRAGHVQDLRQTKGLIMASGAWSGLLNIAGRQLPIAPCKGQMLRVRIPRGLQLDQVHRSERVYVVPRTAGAQAGTALIGATVEDAGFDVTTHAADLARLREWGAELVPELASTSSAPMVDTWAGLRPDTPDGLPMLGRLGDVLVATGHFRNGILLAPATARVIGDLFEDKTPALSLEPFAPGREYMTATT